MITGTPLHRGTASGTILRLTDPLSFWGGFDPVLGLIIDTSHPQYGESMAGRIVVMPGSRGSAGTPSVLGESIRADTGPAALIITKADRNLTTGALVAAALYDIACPVILIDANDIDALPDNTTATITTNGTITVGP